jgi:O-antigen ligase
MLAVVAYNAFEKREDIESLIKVFISSTLILCALGLYEKFTTFNVFTVFGSYLGEQTLEISLRAGEIRIKGPFVHAISFGAYLAMILPLVLYKYRDSYLKFYLSLTLIAIIIMATQSRSAQIGMGIAFISYFIFIEQKKLVILSFASIPVIIAFYDKIFDFFQRLNPFTTTDAALISSTTDRAIQFDYYTGYIKQRILFGYGLEKAPPILRDYLDGTGGVYSSSIDNFYLGYTFQFGIFGLFAWLYLMLAVLIKPVILLGSDILKDKLFLTLLLSCLIFNIINYIVLLLDFHFLFWIYLGIIARLMMLKKEEMNKQNI